MPPPGIGQRDRLFVSFKTLAEITTRGNTCTMHQIHYDKLCIGIYCQTTYVFLLKK